MAEDTTTVAHPNAREYFAALGLTDNSPVTAGQVAGLLEYFGVVPQPDTHAPVPHAVTAAADTPTSDTSAAAAVSSTPAAAPVAVAVTTPAPSFAARALSDVENIAEQLAAALVPALVTRLAGKI